LAANGKIYCSPFTAANVLVIDPATDTFYFIGSVLPKHTGASLGPNGYIYLTPSNGGTTFYAINPDTDEILSWTASFASTNDGHVGGFKLTPLNSMYAIPLTQNYLIKYLGNIGAVTPEMTTIPSPISGLSTSAYNRHQNNL
jgi:hypothetical protein